jgi:hypothetical protein
MLRNSSADSKSSRGLRAGVGVKPMFHVEHPWRLVGRPMFHVEHPWRLVRRPMFHVEHPWRLVGRPMFHVEHPWRLVGRPNGEPRPRREHGSSKTWVCLCTVRPLRWCRCHPASGARSSPMYRAPTSRLPNWQGGALAWLQSSDRVPGVGQPRALQVRTWRFAGSRLPRTPGLTDRHGGTEDTGW